MKSAERAETRGSEDPLAAAPVDAAIIDAAERVITAHGIDKATIEAFAHAAGISRATFYRRAGGREATITTVLRRHARPFVAETNAAVGPETDFAQRITAGLVHAVLALSRYPLLAVTFGDELSAYNLRIVRPVFRELVDATLVAALAAAGPSGSPHRDFDPDELSEWLLRNFLFLASLAPRSRARLERYIATYILPVLDVRRLPTDPGATFDAIDAARADLFDLKRDISALPERLSRIADLLPASTIV